MRRKQRGVTFLGWVILLIPVAIVGYAAIRLTPIYLNYSRVARSISQVAEEAKGDGSATLQSITSAIGRRFDIESIEFPDTKDIAIRREGKSWVIECKYEETVPLMANVGLLVTFQKSARVGEAPTE
jgi:Domain of unknown function (DUF4845)